MYMSVSKDSNVTLVHTGSQRAMYICIGPVYSRSYEYLCLCV